MSERVRLAKGVEFSIQPEVFFSHPLAPVDELLFKVRDLDFLQRALRHCGRYQRRCWQGRLSNAGSALDGHPQERGVTVGGSDGQFPTSPAAMSRSAIRESVWLQCGGRNSDCAFG